MLDIILKWAIPLIGTSLIGILSYIVKNNHAIKKSMVLLLRSQIVGKCEKYLEMGYLPDYARSCLEDLFNQYELLGGNHGVGSLVNQCFSLPPTKRK